MTVNLKKIVEVLSKERGLVHEDLFNKGFLSVYSTKLKYPPRI